MSETLELKKYFNDPITESCQTLFNHLGRYYYAMKTLNITNKDVVIDASCGQGYGAFNLALNSRYVYGLDVNEEYLIIARDNFNLNNLEFMSYKKFREKINQDIDKIVCLETIEHLKSLDEIKIFIDSLVMYLRENGQMFLSFPVGKNKKSSYNSYHLCEPDIKTIHNIFKNYFNVIKIETSKFINNYNHEVKYCFMRGVR